MLYTHYKNAMLDLNVFAAERVDITILTLPVSH